MGVSTSLKACGLCSGGHPPEHPFTKLKPKNGDDIFEQRKQLKLNKGIEERSIKIQEKTDLLYARDTAKKIKSTFRMKGESGKHLTTNPLFGFVKDAEDKDKWLIDEEAAQTVRYIFKLCYDGFGTT